MTVWDGGAWATEAAARALCLRDCALDPADAVQVEQTAAYVDGNWHRYVRRAEAAIEAVAPFVAALTAAAEMRGREDAEQAVMCGCTEGHEGACTAWERGSGLCGRLQAAAIASLPPPSGATALAAMLDQARRDALEEAAAVADTYDRELVRMAVDAWLTDPARRSGHEHPAVTATIEEDGWRKGERAATARHIAAAIRARKETRDAE